MSGPKQINESVDHGEGDLTIRVFLPAVSSTAGDMAQALRMDGNPGQICIFLFENWDV